MGVSFDFIPSPRRPHGSSAGRRFNLRTVLLKRQSDETCWWCGERADSREHKIKKSDLVREFGSGPYKEPLVSSRDGVDRFVQGPDSKIVKFKPTLCAKCNNERSQSYDRSYDQFVAFVHDRERHILASRSIDLRVIYGPDWEDGRDDFFRYIAKHAGCRLAENEVDVPESIRLYLEGGPPPCEELAIEVEIRSDIAAIAKSNLGGGGLWLGDVLLTDLDNAGFATVVESHLGYRWLRIAWGIGSELGGYPWPFQGPVQRLSVGRSLPVGYLSDKNLAA